MTFHLPKPAAGHFAHVMYIRHFLPRVIIEGLFPIILALVCIIEFRSGVELYIAGLMLSLALLWLDSRYTARRYARNLVDAGIMVDAACVLTLSPSGLLMETADGTDSKHIPWTAIGSVSISARTLLLRKGERILCGVGLSSLEEDKRESLLAHIGEMIQKSAAGQIPPALPAPFLEKWKTAEFRSNKVQAKECVTPLSNMRHVFFADVMLYAFAIFVLATLIFLAVFLDVESSTARTIGMIAALAITIDRTTLNKTVINNMVDLTKHRSQWQRDYVVSQDESGAWRKLRVAGRRMSTMRRKCSVIVFDLQKKTICYVADPGDTVPDDLP